MVILLAARDQHESPKVQTVWGCPPMKVARESKNQSCVGQRIVQVQRVDVFQRARAVTYE